MATSFLEFKMDVRIQMHQFHAKAFEIEIELVRQLESNNSNSSRENRLPTMQEHEENMISLRESKEMERKRLRNQERDLMEHQFLRQVADQKAKETRVNVNTSAASSSSKIPPTTQTG